MAGHTLRVSFRARSGRGVWLRDDSLETRPRLRTSPRCTWPSTTSCSQRARREPQTPRSAGRGGGAADAGDAARWPRWLQSGLRGRLCSALASFERGPHALTRVAGSRARALRAFLLPRAEMRRDEGAPPHHCDRPAGGGGGMWLAVRGRIEAWRAATQQRWSRPRHCGFAFGALSALRRAHAWQGGLGRQSVPP